MRGLPMVPSRHAIFSDLKKRSASTPFTPAAVPRKASETKRRPFRRLNWRSALPPANAPTNSTAAAPAISRHSTVVHLRPTSCWTLPLSAACRIARGWVTSASSGIECGLRDVGIAADLEAVGMQREGRAARGDVVHDAMVGNARHLDGEGVVLDPHAVPGDRHDQFLLRPGAAGERQQRHGQKASTQDGHLAPNFTAACSAV